MTITRRFQSSFSTNLAAQESGGNFSTGWTFLGSGGYLDNESVVADDNGSGYRTINTTAQARQGCYVKHNFVDPADNPDLFVFRSTATDVIRIRYDGYTWEALGGATSLATGRSALFEKGNSWHWMACHVKIHASAGWVKFWIDGEVVINYSGKTDHGAADMNRAGLGSISSTVAWANIYIDHWIIDDAAGEASASMPAPAPLIILRPDGNGNYAQWLGSDANSTDNYLLLDEATPNTSDYIEETTVGDRDSWVFTTRTLDPHCTPVSMVAVASAIDAATGNMNIFNRLSGTDVDGSTKTLTASYALYVERFLTKPGGGAWDQTSIDAFEMGARVVA